MRHRSDKSDGRAAGSETLGPLAFLARMATQIPGRGQVIQRYHGSWANRDRRRRR